MVISRRYRPSRRLCRLHKRSNDCIAGPSTTVPHSALCSLLMSDEEVNIMTTATAMLNCTVDARPLIGTCQ
jgi:hypothetical protein